MVDKSEELKARAKEITEGAFSHGDHAEACHFATTMLTNLYGANSPQLEHFRWGCEAIAKAGAKHGDVPSYALWQHAIGTIREARAELAAGLTGQMRAEVAGEVLSELLRLAREILSGGAEPAKNVGAVLVAAAYEDLLRRMGEEFGGVRDRPDLQEVIVALKENQVLKGGEVGTAQSYLKFRNDSLHADWSNVTLAQAESCLAFVEGLLLKHFGG